MNKTGNSLMQVYPSREFKGLSEEGLISNAYLKDPETIAGVLSYAFGQREGNVVSLLTGGIGNVIEVGSKEYRWKLHGQVDSPAEVTEDSTNGNVRPGYNGMEFTLITEERFDPSDNLLADDGETVVHVRSQAQAVAAGWAHSVVLATGGQTSFCDPDFLKPGARWSKENSTVGEYSERGGSHKYHTPEELTNQLSTLRKTCTITRNAALSVMIIELPNPKDPSKSTKLWAKYEEWTAMAAWYKEVDISMLYSKYNKDSTGTVRLRDETERPIYHGAGLLEQIAPSNVRYYTTLTFEILQEFLLDLSYAATAWGGDTNFVALTGKMGMIEFNNAIKAHAKGNNITVTDNGTFITGSGRDLTFTGYFKTVEFLNGYKLTVRQFDPYDELTRNRKLHPISLKPAESYRFTIMNFGARDGQANINKVVMNKSEQLMWHVAGSSNPLTGVVGANASSATGKDGYETHYLSECGIRLGDPYSCGELKLKICA